MNTPKDFLSSLVEGDLVAATNASSAKLHLIHIVRPVTAAMCKGEPSGEALGQMFDGRVLCSARPRFWWRPTDQHEHWKAENKCWHCFAAWRREGYPKIKGWAKVEVPVVSDVRLPWGWHEVTLVGHPLDLAADAPDPDPDENEKKAGSKRIEVKRWVRGPRYVRITQDLTDKRFCLRHGMQDDAADDEGWWVKGGWEMVLLRAITMMACGGMKNEKGRDTLTMRDIQKERR
jgi:hypothetical protein